MIFLIITIPIFIGFGLLNIIFRGKDDILYFIEKLGLAYLIGAFAVTFQMFIYSFITIQFSTVSFGIPWLLLLPAFFIKKEKNRIEIKKFGIVEMIFSFLISLKVAYIFFEALIKPVYAYDAIWNFSLRAKIFFFEKTIPLLRTDPFFMGKGYINYPLLRPLLETWIYVFMNKWDDTVMKIIFPLFFLSLLAIFYSTIARVKGRLPGLFFTFLLSTLPLLTYHATIEYADIIVGVYFFTATVYLYRYFEEKDRRFLFAASLLSAGGAFAKDEGLIFYLICFIVFLLFNKFKNLKSIAIYLSPFIIFSLPWLITKRMMGLNIGNQTTFSLSTLGSFITFRPDVLPKIAQKTFLTDNWHLLPIAFIVVLIFYYKRIITTKIKYIFACFTMACGFFMALYIFTPNNAGMIFQDIILSRNYITYLPIALLIIALVLDFKRTEL